MRNLVLKGFDVLFWLYLRLHRLVLRAASARALGISRNRLQEFIRCDHSTRDWFIARMAMPLFGGLHPKNVFNFRHEFFGENLVGGDCVLDVACGSGLTLSKMAPTIRRGIGIDMSTENLRLCRQHHSAANLDFIEADILDFDFEELRTRLGITVAVLSHILEHIEDPVALLRRINVDRLLICVPSQENWYTQLKIHLGLPYFRDPTHFREYSRDMLVQQLQDAGYRAVQVAFNSEGEICCRAERLQR